MKNCPNCGRENPDTNRFCESCGADITAGQNNANTGAGGPIPNVTNSADTVYNGNGSGNNYSYGQNNSAPYGQQNGYNYNNYNNVPQAGGDYTVIGIISLCLGFVSLMGIQCCYLFPIAAIVLGIIGLVKTKYQKGVAWGLSLAGLICGSLGLVVWGIIDIILAIPTMGASFIV